MRRKERQFHKLRCAAAAFAALAMVTACSSMKFLATGKEFRKICEDNGLQVQDTSASLKETGSYTSLSDSYLATDEENGYSVCYVRFSDSKEAQSYYDSVAQQMNGTEYTGPNYQAEVETVNDSCREIYMESGRIIYAEGDAAAISAIEAQLIGTWNQDPVKKTAGQEQKPQDKA